MASSFGRNDSGMTDGSQPTDQHGERMALLHHGQRRFKRVLSGFVDFAFSGNVLDVAFGLM